LEPSSGGARLQSTTEEIASEGPPNNNNDCVILPILLPEDFRVKALNIIFKSSYPYNLPSLLKTIKPNLRGRSAKDREYHKHYVALYRFLKLLEKHGFVKLSKNDGLIWIYPVKLPFDLILSVKQKSNFCDSCDSRWWAIPKKIRPEREEAIRVVQSLKLLDDKDKDLLRDLFLDYLDDVKNRRIVLLSKYNCDDPLELIKVIPYKTRFTDPSYTKRLLKHYNKIWVKASNDFKFGVFLTVTTDPNRFGNLWLGWRHFNVALNRFFSYLRKYSESKIVYLCAYEFTDSGLLHAHIVLFGLKYLLPKRAITYLWDRCGQGTINYVYAIQNVNGKWVWARRKPERAKRSESVSEYLKKYIVKTIVRKIDNYLYWVSGKRFYAYSIRYFTMEKLSKVKESIYAFFGSYNIYDMPLWLQVFIKEQVLVWLPHSLRSKLIIAGNDERFRPATLISFGNHTV
jgi:hypothetical protein